MDKMIPLTVDFPIRQDRCDLVSLNWTPHIFSADFASSGAVIRAQFRNVLAYRVVDEVLDSIDGEGVRDGATAAGFAYLVQDGAFLANYPNVDSYHPHPSGPLRQFAFISLDWCLEVLAHTPPEFYLVEAS
jgi:hypothetical protein